MAAVIVTVILDRVDGAENPYVKGTATWTPSLEFPDVADQQLVGMAPVTATFRAGGFPVVKVIANDTAGPQGATTPGWTWNVSYSGVPGSPPDASYFVLASNGLTQRLSSLAQMPAGQPGGAYLAVQGTPSAGALPAYQSGTTVAWETPATAAQAFASAAGDKVSAQLYGADPTGAVAIDTIVNDLISGLPVAGGEIFLGEGTFKVSSGLLAELANSQTVRIRGAAGLATVLQYHGSGDCVRMFNPSTQPQGSPGNTFSMGSGVSDLTIDGSNAGTGAAGLHMGDLMNAKVDVIIRNFSGAGSKGLWLDNTVSWFEQCDVRAAVLNCTQHVVFEVTTGYYSFGYGNFDFTIQALALQDGVVLKNGAQPYNGSMRIRGNFFGSTNSANAAKAVFRASGVAPVGSPNAGVTCKLFGMELDWQVECATTGGTFAPATMILDTVNFFVSFQNTGIVNFLNAGLAFTQAQSAGTGLNQFQFSGIFSGDPSLSLASGQGYQAVSQPSSIYTNALGVFTGQGNLPTTKGDFFDVGVLSANTTVTMNYFGGSTLGVPQRITIRVKQAASGGPYTVAWQKNASPSPSAPTVLWPGGTAPTMSAAANAVDFYDLETFDGVTWVGSARQNVS